MAEHEDEYLPSSLRPVDRRSVVSRIVILVVGLLIAAGLGGIYYRWHAKQKAEAVAVLRRIVWGGCISRVHMQITNLEGYVYYQKNGVFAKFVNEVTVKRGIALPSRPGDYNYCDPALRDALADHLEDLTK